MQNITTMADLKSAIQFLELEHEIKGQLLKEQLQFTYKNFKPVNLLLGTIKDIATSPNVIDNLIGAVVGMATGYLSKKIVVGASSSIFRNIIGSLLQFGVSKTISEHPQGIKTIGQFIIQQFIKRKLNDE